MNPIVILHHNSDLDFQAKFLTLSKNTALDCNYNFDSDPFPDSNLKYDILKFLFYIVKNIFFLYSEAIGKILYLFWIKNKSCNLDYVLFYMHYNHLGGQALQYAFFYFQCCIYHCAWVLCIANLNNIYNTSCSY